jgi:hypothetical protein
VAGPHCIETSAATLRAIAGARSVLTAITPVRTMPGAEATIGRLTSEARKTIEEARMSVVCSSFNFSRRSWMWTALHAATTRPGVNVTIYLDGRNPSVRLGNVPFGAPVNPRNSCARLTVSDKWRSSAGGVCADQRQVPTTNDKPGMVAGW